MPDRTRANRLVTASGCILCSEGHPRKLNAEYYLTGYFVNPGVFLLGQSEGGSLDPNRSYRGPRQQRFTAPILSLGPTFGPTANFPGNSCEFVLGSLRKWKAHETRAMRHTGASNASPGEDMSRVCSCSATQRLPTKETSIEICAEYGSTRTWQVGSGAWKRLWPRPARLSGMRQGGRKLMSGKQLARGSSSAEATLMTEEPKTTGIKPPEQR